MTEFVNAMETKARQEREYFYEIISKMDVDASPEIAFALFLGMYMKQNEEQKANHKTILGDERCGKYQQ